MKKALPTLEFVLSGEDDGVLRNSLVSDPANETHWIALSKEEPVIKFARDEMKRNISGPLLIPEQRIRRNGGADGPFLGYFSKETIEEVARKYAKGLKFAQVNIQHRDETEGVYVIEQWITSTRDKSQDLGFDLPPGSLFVTMHVENDAVWNRVMSGELRGFSIEGRFGTAAVEASVETPEAPKEKTEQDLVEEFMTSLTSDDMTDDEKLDLIKKILLDAQK